MPLTLVTGETAYQPIITGKCFLFFFDVAMLPISYYEHNRNTVCHKNFVNESFSSVQARLP